MDNMKADTNCYMDKNWPSHLIAHNYGIEDLNKLINIINQERLDIHQKLADRQVCSRYHSILILLIIFTYIQTDWNNLMKKKKKRKSIT